MELLDHYLMIRTQVYHNAWRELCEGMAAARSLDEVIEVHELYLLTIQRQCFVVPDKLVGCCLCLRAYVPFCYYSKKKLNKIHYAATKLNWGNVLSFVSVGSHCYQDKQHFGISIGLLLYTADT